jgi:hypothetical protein
MRHLKASVKKTDGPLLNEHPMLIRRGCVDVLPAPCCPNWPWWGREESNASEQPSRNLKETYPWRDKLKGRNQSIRTQVS